MASSAARPRVRADVADVADVLVGLATTIVGFGLGAFLAKDVEVDSWWAVVASGVLLWLADILLREPLRRFARVGGALVAVLLGLAVQVTVAYAALVLAPGITVNSTWGVVQVLVITALVMVAGRWLLGLNDSDHVVADVLRRARRESRRRAREQAGERGAAGTSAPAPRPGLLVVQLDGVGERVLREALDAGLVPTMQRWIDTGTHRLDSWWARVPSTTPASQAGLLHGDSTQIPAFRWWDRDLRRMVVTNHPADAALVESRLTTGEGLLAGGGTSVSTMFTGDAATALLVMSRTRGGEGAGVGSGDQFVRFFSSPFVLVRALLLAAGEMVKESYQARRQRARDVRPRISRRGWYVVLRAVTNVLLRDLNTLLVAEALQRGDPTIYVDLVDYDEIAHHAGPSRPESLRALEGLDRVLYAFERVVSVAPRAYRVVVLSDHGQALGETFEDRTGRSLLDTVRALMADPDASAVSSTAGEEWGPFNALLTSTALPTGSSGGPDVGVAPVVEVGSGDSDVAPPEVAVIASGNLGLVWFPREPARQTIEDLAESRPGLVAGLAATPGIGVVVVDSQRDGLVAVGEHGLVLLERDDAPVEGVDPLLPYGPRGRLDLARAARLPNTGDLLLVSDVDESGRIHAFEDQVGSHGGIGGAQNGALLLHPADWPVDDDLREDVGDRRMLVGAESVHAQLLRWSRSVGLRS